MSSGLTIQGLQLQYRILQSPMAGCTDLPYRKIARRFGCELAFCEMVKDRPVVENNRRTNELLATEKGDTPLGMQLVGRDPLLMAEAARRLEQRGAAVIDINLGCPVRKVVAEGCGSALLKEPDHLARILEKMIEAVSVPVTIKIRIGFDDEEPDGFLKIARVADQCGAGAITVHGRTRLQRFSGMSNHSAIKAVKETVSMPVIGNGNIRNGRDAKKMMEDTGCDGVMVARGALGNPWIYREIATYLGTGEELPPPSVAEQAAVLRDHFEEMRLFYGDRAFYLVRRVIHWFVKGAPGAAQLRHQGNFVASAGDFEDLVKTFEDSVQDHVPTPLP